jgi:hypothetical protein
MKPNTETKITADAVLKAVEQGAKSTTAIAKLLGYKSGSSFIIKRIIAVCPDIKGRLAKNVKTATAEKMVASPQNFPMPDCVPFRPTSGYAMVWSILYAHRKDGIGKPELTAQYQKWCKKADKNCAYDVHVVISSNRDGSSHASVSKAAQCYWVERNGDTLKLHLVPEEK